MQKSENTFLTKISQRKEHDLTVKASGFAAVLQRFRKPKRYYRLLAANGSDTRSLWFVVSLKGNWSCDQADSDSTGRVPMLGENGSARFKHRRMALESPASESRKKWFGP